MCGSQRFIFACLRSYSVCMMEDNMSTLCWSVAACLKLLVYCCTLSVSARVCACHCSLSESQRLWHLITQKSILEMFGSTASTETSTWNRNFRPKSLRNLSDLQFSKTALRESCVLLRLRVFFASIPSHADVTEQHPPTHMLFLPFRIRAIMYCAFISC